MPSATTCPSAADLERLLLGLIEGEQSAELERHLAHCPMCAQRARDLPAEDLVVQALRTISPETEIDRPEMVDVLVPLFKRMRPAIGATGTWSAEGPPTIDTVPGTADTSFLTAPVEAGEIGRIGPYAVHELLGAGGMGVVYRGYDPRLQRAIAIKVVQPHCLARPGMVERFLQEARSAAQVEHDHIVGVFAVEDHDGVPCIIMPLLRGQSLEQRLLAAAGPLPLAEVLRIGRETASGLAAAHERGLIHRDIKPPNLWLEAPRGRVKILDFGLAFVRAADADEPGTIAGTPGYMAPEQARGQPLDHRADLFSLGCVLYRAATGKPPFAGAQTFTALVRVVLDQPRPVPEINPNLPPALSELIDQLLAKDPAQRPESAAAVVEAVSAIENEFAVRRARQARRRWLLAVAAAAAVGGGFAWVLRPQPAVPAPVAAAPVAVTFVCDSPAPTVIFSRDGEEQTADLATYGTLFLAPGEYQLRPAKPLPGRALVPESVLVNADEPQMVKLALVGEVMRHAAPTQTVMGVAVVAGKAGLTVFAAGGDRTLEQWQPGSKKSQHLDLTSPALCLAVSRDGSTVAAAGGDKRQPQLLLIHLWDTATLRAKGEPLAGHRRLIRAVAFLPDGKQLLSAAGDEVFLWDLQSRKYRALEDDDANGIVTAAVSADGQRALTGGEEGRLILWDLRTGKPLRKWAAGAETVRAVAFLPGGFVTAGDDGIIRIWDERTFQARELKTRGKPVLALAVSPDATRLLCGGADGILSLWSVADGRSVYSFTRFDGLPRNGSIRAAAFTPDGRQAVSGGADRVIRLWQLPF